MVLRGVGWEHMDLVLSQLPDAPTAPAPVPACPFSSDLSF